ncbi:MAG: MmgE/PrpD family protein [Betaproteobacteria bacterium]|nr:MmgE/PrpD family protein [Betaproteobacteria bacterium]
MPVAADLARLVNQTRYEDLPALAIDHAAMLIASTIASAGMGQNIRSARIVRELVKEQGGKPEATVWFDGAKLPAVNAARANALTSDAAASDDSDLRTIAHLGTQLTSTTLALAEKTGASGKEILAAFVPAYEVAGRIAAAIIPHYRNQGFHGSLAVIFAAAVASGRLLKLNDAQMSQVIAMAAVSMGGLGTAADTSEAREWFAGNAALGGMNAAYAAQKGYEVEDTIFETKKGFLDVFGGPGCDAGSLTRDWGQQDHNWDIVTDMAIKLVPGGHPSHALGEAAANAAREANVAADQIDSIVMTQPLNPKLRTGVMKPPSHPKNLVDIAHTPAYFVAAGVADKAFSWVHASEAKIHDPTIHALIDKIKVGEPITQDVHQYMHGARVTINTKAGKSFSNTVYAPRGSGVRGIEWKDVDEKYRTLVAFTGASTQKMNDTLDVIHNFREAANVAKLIALIS